MTSQIMRVVLDLNVLVSAYFFSKPSAPPRQLLHSVLNGQITILHSPAYCTDLIEAFSKQKFVVRLAQIHQTPESIVSMVKHLGEAVPQTTLPLGIVRDQDDAVILACAVSGNADYIVSGDLDLTILVSY